MFKGSIVALITPFKNDKLDEENYINLIHHHLKSGTHGLVPGGTTGESPTLSHKEHHKIINLSVKECKYLIMYLLSREETKGKSFIFVFLQTNKFPNSSETEETELLGVSKICLIKVKCMWK